MRIKIPVVLVENIVWLADVSTPLFYTRTLCPSAPHGVREGVAGKGQGGFVTWSSCMTSADEGISSSLLQSNLQVNTWRFISTFIYLCYVKNVTVFKGCTSMYILFII